MGPAQGEIHVWWVDLDDRTRLSTERALAFLDAGEREPAGRVVPERERERRIARRAHLRLLLGHYAGLDPRSLPIGTGSHGKPGCPAVPRLAFSCSSSGSLALYAFGRSRLGVDVEARPSGTWEAMPVSRYLSSREREVIAALPAQLRRTREVEAWVLKEAVAKGVGAGFDLPPDGLEVSFDQGAPRVAFGGAWQPERSGAWTLRLLESHDHRVAALATDGPLIRTIVRSWSGVDGADGRVPTLRA